MTMPDHDACRVRLQETWARACQEQGDPGAEITISTLPPIVDSPWTQVVQCPHGVPFWCEPTGDQLAKWYAEVRGG